MLRLTTGTTTAPAEPRDRGAALIAVIGVMAVIAIITITVAGTTLSALGVTSATRAGVQAQAAAEAGIAAANASLARQACPPLASPGGAPRYTIKLSYQSGGGWIDGCPQSGSTRVRVLSTGTADLRGPANNASGDTRTVEAIYGSAATEPVVTAAITAHSGVAFTDSSQLQPGDDNQPVVQAGAGNVSCAGSNVLTADLVIALGSLALEQSCQLFGTAQVGGQARIAGSVIVHGDLSAQSLTTSQSSIVRGNAAIVKAATLTDSSQVQGNLNAESLVTTGSSQVGGTITLGPSAPVPAPTGPRWVDFSYEKPEWTGFVKKSASGICNFLTLQPLVADVSSPVLIDARGCIGGIRTLTAEILTLSNDLVIIANSFQLGGSAQFQAVGSARLWLITPDETNDGAPTCAGGPAASVISGSFIAGTGVTAMLYTPCPLTMMNSAIWHGQFYGATVGVRMSSILRYQAMPFPGVNVSSVPRAGVFELGARESLRDVARDPSANAAEATQ
ncbi:polymer-forming cytoskeletal protein [Cryobacterium frigoriphilum]|uniref:polymer-forming cytoskeletal protein n=1 Tax=Cryobacterium frigoriphilum TaxID=1259150 RepID=UPI00141B6402|nr:polymer-forming cytoskeletal protein [Cryobacterium frigoriphilum]